MEYVYHYSIKTEQGFTSGLVTSNEKIDNIEKFKNIEFNLYEKYNSNPNKSTLTSFSFLHEIEEQAQKTKLCKMCDSDSISKRFIKKGKWLGEPINITYDNELMTKEEHTYGWDIYSDIDLFLVKCNECKFEEYIKGLK